MWWLSANNVIICEEKPMSKVWAYRELSGKKYFDVFLGDGAKTRPGDLLVAGLGDDRNTVGRACVAPSGIAPAMVRCVSASHLMMAILHPKDRFTA
jgi:hypothetical protein